tara:strand:+ start:235 stop:549 length:315 start_codon:yes stop_codon:yes gene_type:complete
LNAENKEGNKVIIGALNKITAKFYDFEINVGNSMKFGTLDIKIIKCIKRPPEEIPEDFVLIKIIENTGINKKNTIFSGWMLSSSPSLSALEHSSYDIWVKKCMV